MNEPIERKQLHLRLPVSIYGKIEKKAKKKGVTMNNYIAYIAALDLDEINDKLDLIVHQLEKENEKEGEIEK